MKTMGPRIAKTILKYKNKVGGIFLDLSCNDQHKMVLAEQTHKPRGQGTGLERDTCKYAQLILFVWLRFFLK